MHIKKYVTHLKITNRCRTGDYYGLLEEMSTKPITNA